MTQYIVWEDGKAVLVDKEPVEAWGWVDDLALESELDNNKED